MKSGTRPFLVLVVVVEILAPSRCLAYEQFALTPRIGLLFDTHEQTRTSDIKYGNGNGVGLTAIIPAWSSQVGLMADYYTYEAEAFIDNESVASLDMRRLNVKLYYLTGLGAQPRVGTYPLCWGYGFFYNYVEYAAPVSSSPEDSGMGASTPFSFESLELLRLHLFGFGSDLIFHHNTKSGLFFNATLGAKFGLGYPNAPEGLRSKYNSWEGISYSFNVGFEKDLVTWCYGFSVGYLGLLEEDQERFGRSSNGRQYFLEPAMLDLSAFTIQGFVRF